MPTIGDFFVITDQGPTLQIGGDIDFGPFAFVLPNNPNEGFTAILTLLRVVQNPDNLRWRMAINGTSLATYTEESNHRGVVQESFSGSLLNGPNNTVTVTVLSGEGRLTVSDIVLHYHVDV